MNAAISFFNRSESKAEPQPKTKAVKPESMVQLNSLIPQISAVALAVLLILVSALAVIYTSFDYRRHFHQQQTLVRQNDQIRIEWGQLLLEQSAWGANNRVEVLAADKLSMKLPGPAEIRLVHGG